MDEFVVYILFSEKHGKTYVGFTSNLIERFNIRLSNELQTPLHFIIENWKDDEIHKKILNSLLEQKNINSFINCTNI